MKKLINSPDTLVEETLEGYALMHRDTIALVPGTHIVERRRKKPAGKVKLILGNGAGHEPAVIGWVGEGMLDANIVGEVFTAPSSDKLLAAMEYLNDGSPILLAVQNHAGDVLNANLAYAEALERGIPVRKVLFYDDIASAPKGMEEERRGIAGMFFYVKLVGAFLEDGGGLDDAAALFEEVRDNTRTFSVAITSCTHPLTGMEIVSLPGDEIELGMGVHGEGSGASRIPLPTSAELAEEMAGRLIADLPYKPGEEILLFLNGLGGTTAMELSLLYKDIWKAVERAGLRVHDGFCGNCLTTQELSGVSLSFCRVDERMKRLWAAPCNSPLYSKR